MRSLKQHIRACAHAQRERRSSASTYGCKPAIVPPMRGPGFTTYLRRRTAKADQRNLCTLAVRPVEQCHDQSFSQRKPFPAKHGTRTIEHEAMQRAAVALLAMKSQMSFIQRLIAFFQQRSQPVDARARFAPARSRST